MNSADSKLHNKEGQLSLDKQGALDPIQGSVDGLVSVGHNVDMVVNTLMPVLKGKLGITDNELKIEIKKAYKSAYLLSLQDKNIHKASA